MYSNDNKKGFSILDIIVKIILFGLFIFILVWLFNKKVPNMTPFYSNVFRENIKYMQEAAESYFTDDKMPKKVGDEVKILLGEMIDKKIILPFVDKDGNACDLYSSYVSITKQEDESYILKTNLVCGEEKDYTIKVLGCHTYCKDKDCEKTCSIEKLTSYQYKKLVTSTSTKYSCDSGYTLKGKYCYKTVLKDTKSAETKITETKTYTEDALAKVTSGTKTQLTTVVTENKTYVDRKVTTTPSTTKTETQSYSCTKTKTESQPYSCTKTKTENQCTTTTSTVKYECNCTGHFSGGQYVTSCSTCSKNVTTETCKDVNVPYTTTCYKDVEVQYEDTCTKEVEVTVPGTTTYSCPAGSFAEGSGSSLKCYTVSKTYSCPTETDYKTGSGASLKCYDVKEGKVTYYCADDSYTLNGTKCTKTVKETSVEYSCPSDYKLEGKLCKKYETEKEKADAEKVTNKYYKYTWSTKTSLSGWTKTGKTKTVNGKEICE